MAIFNSVNKVKQDVNVPPTIVPQGEINARMKVQYDEFTHSAAPSTNDEVDFLPLPAGARIHEVVLVHGSLGSNGLVALGWRAEGTETADDDGFIVAGATKNAALNKTMTDVVGQAAQFKKFAGVITPVMKFAEGPTAASATYKVAIYYTID